MPHKPVVRALLGGAVFVANVPLLASEVQAEASSSPPLTSAIIVTARAAPIPPELFGTVALPVRAERYNAGWERARRDASGSPLMATMIAPARKLDREQQLAFVQGAVHRRIRWMSDATEWGAHDYWASATETLARSAGDAEDRAIVKMQALKALGVPTRDLYITIGRDRVGGEMAVLIVRTGGRHWVLDDSGGTPFTTDRRPDFQPMVTLGFGGSWVHGRRFVPARQAASATAATAAIASTR